MPNMSHSLFGVGICDGGVGSNKDRAFVKSGLLKRAKSNILYLSAQAFIFSTVILIYM